MIVITDEEFFDNTDLSYLDSDDDSSNLNKRGFNSSGNACGWGNSTVNNENDFNIFTLNNILYTMDTIMDINKFYRYIPFEIKTSFKIELI